MLIYVATQFDLRVEDLELPGLEDEWGYAYKRITGTSVWSNHASGTAIDLNATRHPYGKRGTFQRVQVAEIREIISECDGLIAWGGDWHNPDEMHFEIRGTLAQVECWAEKHHNGPVIPPKRPTLVKGSRGGYVRDIQRVLNRWYPNIRPLLTEDGIFGPMTESRVKYFQGRAKITVDGIVGPQTWHALGFR